MAKKSDEWSMTVHVTSTAINESLKACLACEDVSSQINDDTLIIELTGKSASDLRARYNSMMRSITAATDALKNIG